MEQHVPKRGDGASETCCVLYFIILLHGLRSFAVISAENISCFQLPKVVTQIESIH